MITSRSYVSIGTSWKEVNQVYYIGDILEIVLVFFNLYYNFSYYKVD